MNSSINYQRLWILLETILLIIGFKTLIATYAIMINQMMNDKNLTEIQYFEESSRRQTNVSIQRCQIGTFPITFDTYSSGPFGAVSEQLGSATMAPFIVRGKKCSGARQVSWKSLVCWTEYSVAILFYCFKNIWIFHYNTLENLADFTVMVNFTLIVHLLKT